MAIVRMLAAIARLQGPIRRIFPLVSALVVAAAIGGCTFVVDRPPGLNVEQRAAGVPYKSAVIYLNDTYALFQGQIENFDRFDLGTKSGVALGVGGAGISAAFRSGVDPILGFLTGGAVNFAANQLVDPKSLGDVFNAGLKNLVCIQSAGSAAYDASGAIREAGSEIAAPIRAAIDSLRADIAMAGAKPAYASDVVAAESAIVTGLTTIANFKRYENGVNVGEAMVASIDATIAGVNEQVRAKAPSLQAVAQSGAIFSNFIGSNANLRSQVNKARSGLTLQGAPDRAPVKRDALQQKFDADEALLKGLIAGIPPFDSATLSAIGNCKAQFAAEAAVTVSESSVSLAAGDKHSVTLTGSPPLFGSFSGVTPSDVHADSNLINQILFSADQNAKAGTYTYAVFDREGKSAGPITVTVTAAAAKPPPPPPPVKAPPVKAGAAADAAPVVVGPPLPPPDRGAPTPDKPAPAVDEGKKQ